MHTVWLKVSQNQWLVRALSQTSDVSPWSWPCDSSPWPWPRLHRPDATMLYTCVHYVHSSTTSTILYHLTVTQSLQTFVVPAQPVEKVFFLTVGWSSAHIVQKCETSCWSHWCLLSVLSSADCCELVMVNVRGVTNFVITGIFLGVYCLAFFFVNFHYQQ